MMSPFARLTLALTLLATIDLPAFADVILLRQAIEETPDNTASGIERPSSGMSMVEVKQRFGEPLQQRQSVGDPPISRWLYRGYTVYFEHNRVINAVVHKPNPVDAPESGPATKLTRLPAQTGGDQSIR